MSPGQITKVAIVENIKEIREGLGQLINASPGFCCSGIYVSMEEALEKIPHNPPDLVLSDIADLNVSVNTIKFHLRHIFDKLHVHTKPEAVAIALRHGLTR